MKPAMKPGLSISRETLRVLSSVNLIGVAGGRTFSARPDIGCEPPTITCNTMCGGCGSGGSANTCDACSLTSF